jgi:hypothetical protein
MCNETFPLEPVASGCLGKAEYARFFCQTKYFEANRYEVMFHETCTLEPVASGCPGKGDYPRSLF